MANTAVCGDTSDAVDFFKPQGIYLKPIAKLNVSVQLPQLKTPGKSISNWEVMEKIKQMIRPEAFLCLKIVKSTLEFLRFEGEIENKSMLLTVIARLDTKTMKLSGFPDQLKVRAAEAKCTFPVRYDWDSYFRDAKNMNEMKAGERPDTIHIKDLPSRWFANRKAQDKSQPKEYILRKVFEIFGDVRCVDIPMLDPYRKEMISGSKMALQTFTYGQDLIFEAYIQYKEYISFVKAMDSLRGMKLLYKEDGKAYTTNLKVDFDKTKHLSEKNIRRRRLEREKLKQLEQQKEDKVKREREAEEKMKEDERLRLEAKRKKHEERQQAREEKRRQKILERKRIEEENKMALKIALEERKLLLAQRKLESIRLLTVLLDRVKNQKYTEDVERREQELEEERYRQAAVHKLKIVNQEQKRILAEKRKRERLQRQEQILRNKILKNIKTIEDRKTEKEREALRNKIAGKVKLKSAIVMKR